jgi:hypothetical protein
VPELPKSPKLKSKLLKDKGAKASNWQLKAFDHPISRSRAITRSYRFSPRLGGEHFPDPR